jgi:predicted peroxiredoxin
VADDAAGGLGYNPTMAGRTVVFLASDAPHALRSAGACALAAVAMDRRVDVFLTGPAVGAVVATHDGEADDAAALLHQARAAGARLIACSASVVEQRLAPGQAEAALDAVVGWPTILEWSGGVVDRFSF